MRLPNWMLRRLQAWADRKMSERDADFYIGGRDNPYLIRWWVIPRNRFFNIYLHKIIRSDDDRALHDHPWWNVSLLLRSLYREHTIEAGGIHKRVIRCAGDIKFRSPKAAHRLEVFESCDPVVTLFITGPVVRGWGFHCPLGWVPWQRFVDETDSGNVGRGCGELDLPRM